MRGFITVICLFSASNAVAIDYCSKNHINLGLDTFYRDYSEDLVSPKKSDESGMLYGVVLGYEHKAPDSIMFNIEFDLAGGKTHYDGSLQNYYGDYIGPWESVTVNAFLNIDAETGYTFVKRGRHLLTPFIGLGVSSWARGVDYDNEIYTWSYVSSGLQYDYDANRHWQYGLHVKVMQMLHGMMKAPDVSSYEMTLGNKTHFEVSAPIIYKHNPDSKNYWRFTPYYQYQSFGESDWVPADIYFNLRYLGIQLSEPASRTHIVGARVEYSFGF